MLDVFTKQCTAQYKNCSYDLSGYAIMSIVESGLSISILSQLILKRVPYKILARELDVPAYRNIGFALKSKKSASLAVKRFLEYLQYR